MSLIDEIRSQRPAVRHTFFVLSVVVALGVLGFFGVSALHREMYAALHTPQEQAALADQQSAQLPDPLAFIAHAAGSLTASIGSLLGFDSKAGFDRQEQSGNTQGDVHLLPLSQ
jgi:hypothetical protein